MAITVGTIGIGVGPGGIRDSVRYLADCDWLTLTVENGRARIGLGVDARKLLEEATAPELRNVCACRPKDRLSLSEGVGLTCCPGYGGARLLTYRTHRRLRGEGPTLCECCRFPASAGHRRA